MSSKLSRAVAAVALPTTATVAVLGAYVYTHAPGPLDQGAEAWALAQRTPALLRAFAAISRFGAPAFVFATTAIVALLLWRGPARHRASGREAALLVAAPAFAVFAFNVIKLLVHRTRPAGGSLLPLLTYSFPSGHAAVSAAGFLTLGWVLARDGRVPRWLAALIAVVPPLAIGASRVYLDVHWATDVIAGWCLGAAIAALAAAAYERMRAAAAAP